MEHGDTERSAWCEVGSNYGPDRGDHCGRGHSGELGDGAAVVEYLERQPQRTLNELLCRRIQFDDRRQLCVPGTERPPHTRRAGSSGLIIPR